MMYGRSCLANRLSEMLSGRKFCLGYVWLVLMSGILCVADRLCLSSTLSDSGSICLVDCVVSKLCMDSGYPR